MNLDLLLFTDHYPFGSSEPFIADELPYLQKAFRSIKIIPLDTSENSVQRQVPQGVEIIRPRHRNFKSKMLLLYQGITGQGNLGLLIRELLKSKAYKSPAKFRHWLTVLLFIRTYFPVFKNVTDSSHDPEETVLYFYWGQRWSQLLPFISEKFKNTIVRMHGSDLYEELYDGYIPFRYQQIQKVTRVFTISEFGKKYLTKSYPEFFNKIDIARLGTDDHGLNPWEDKERLSYTIVSCASLTKTKRVPLIVEILRHTSLPIQWHHFGDGPEMQHLQTTCKDLPKTVTCVMGGNVVPDELFNFYAETPIDLFLNVSFSEGVPVSIMEALSFGIPVMATDVGGTSELVNSKNGQLIPKNFLPSEIGKLIDILLQSKTLPDMRIAARETWARRSDTTKVYPEFITKLTAAIDRTEKP